MNLITYSIIVIVVASLVPGFAAENNDFKDAEEDELIKQAIETLVYLDQHNRSLESSIITSDLAELKQLIQLIPYVYGYGRSTALNLRMEDVKLCLRKEIFNAYNQPDSIACLEMSKLSKYVLKLSLDINLDRYNLQPNYPVYQTILRDIAEKALNLEQQIQQADSKNSALAEMLLQQYYHIRNEYFQARESLPYFEQITKLENIANFFEGRISADISELRAKNLTDLAEELKKDSNNLQNLVNDLNRQQDVSGIVNKTNALRVYQQLLQQRLYEIETKHIHPK